MSFVSDSFLPDHTDPQKAPEYLLPVQIEGPGVVVDFERVDIRRGVEWSYCAPQSTVIVHLGGKMNQLETELEHHGGSRGPALAGEIWTIPAGHRYRSQMRGQEIGYAAIVLEPHLLARACEMSSAPGGFSALAGARDPFLHQTLRQLGQIARNTDDLSGMLAQTLLQGIGLHLWRQYARETPRIVSGPRLSLPKIRRLRDFIHDNLSERITLAQLSVIAGQSTHQLLIAFRQAFGMTPWQYIIAQRLRSAQRLLMSSRHDITTIAHATGFSSHSHLTSSFRRCLGCSPSEFRATQA